MNSYKRVRMPGPWWSALCAVERLASEGVECSLGNLFSQPEVNGYTLSGLRGLLRRCEQAGLLDKDFKTCVEDKSGHFYVLTDKGYQLAHYYREMGQSAQLHSRRYEGGF